MKPTKEQLADPKWWDTYAKDGNDKCYWDEKEGSVMFTSNGDLYVYYELLAKRPKPEKWVPEVGDESLLPDVGSIVGIYLASLGDILIPHVVKGYKVWKSINNDSDHHRVFILLGPSNDKRSGNNERLLNDIHPLKTEREQFIEKAINTGDMKAKMHLPSFIGVLYDAGCRFDLTKKDGE